MKRQRNKLNNTNPMLVLLLGYLLVIFVGTILLSLRFAVKDDGRASFMDAIFASVSCTCVTGLTRYDTFLHWSLFGQIVQLLLIQIGGVGFMTLAFSVFSLMNHNIGLNSRIMIQNSMNAPQLGGILHMTRFVFLLVSVIELSGTALLCIYYCPIYGATGIWYSFFHAVSAFCNAGFDLMGMRLESSSLGTMTGNPLPLLVIMILIILGGQGFYTIKDLLSTRFRWKNLRLQTKLALSTNCILFLAGGLLIFCFEFFGHAFDGLGFGNRLLNSFFQEVTSRSAGFTTVDLTALTEPTLFLMLLLTFVGGSVGSTSGGMKVETLAVLTLNIKSTFKRRKDPEIFGRRIEDETTQIATTVLMLYIFLATIATIIVTFIEGCPLQNAFFECISSITTSGFSCGLVKECSIATECILMLLMVFGRVGSITMLLAFSSSHLTINNKLPGESIRVG